MKFVETPFGQGFTATLSHEDAPFCEIIKYNSKTPFDFKTTPNGPDLSTIYELIDVYFEPQAQAYSPHQISSFQTLLNNAHEEGYLIK